MPIIIMDEEASIELGLWNQQFTNIDDNSVGKKIAVKFAEITTWNRCSLKLNGSITIDPPNIKDTSIDRIVAMNSKEREALFTQLRCLSADLGKNIDWNTVKLRTIKDMIKIEDQIYEQKIDISENLEYSIIEADISSCLETTYYYITNKDKSRVSVKSSNGKFIDKDGNWFDTAQPAYKLIFTISDSTSNKQLRCAAYVKVF